MVKNPLAKADEGSIPGLGRSSGRGMATHSSILAWIIPWTEEPGGLQSMGSQSDMTEQLSMNAYIYLLFFGFLSHLGHHRKLSRVS